MYLVLQVYEPANVFYTQTVEKFQQNYFRTNANSRTNINHDRKHRRRLSLKAVKTQMLDKSTIGLETKVMIG
jgi:hypothetical protein